MRVALTKIAGVESAEVSLNQGVAIVRFRPDNRVTVEQVREVVRSNGFTPKAADVRVRGRVIDQDGALALSVPGQNSVYRLLDHPDTAAAIPRVRASVGKTVVIEGTVPEMPRRDDPIEVLRVRGIAPSREP